VSAAPLDLNSLFDEAVKRKRAGRLAIHGLLRFYQLTLSSVIGRTCRHMPSCSAYMDEAVLRHGVWPGLWMGTARLCRCHPWGTSGIDNVPMVLPDKGRWWKPWGYGFWAWRQKP